MPGKNDAPLNSDVAIWRLSWKLAQAGRHMPPHFIDGDIVHLFGGDDLDARIKS